MLLPGHRKIRGLSSYVLRSTGIAANTKTWILDEPFAGLDEESVKAVKKILDQHVQNHGCIILANHQEILATSNKILLEKNV